MRVFTNSNRHHDRLQKYLDDSCRNSRLSIAVAFFSNKDFIQKAIDHGCSIRLVVRLNQGTSPEHLRAILGKQNIDIRYFTAETFHPKLYLIHNDCAIIGSSNLTKSGLTTNQEVNIRIESEDPSFQHLEAIFNEYWAEAEPLTRHTLDRFTQLIAQHTSKNVNPTDFIESEIGKVEFANVDNPDNKKDHRFAFISAFRKEYQEYISSFRKLATFYMGASDSRRWANLPLRMEVDRFLWWIREVYAGGDRYKNVATMSDHEIAVSLVNYKREFLAYEKKVIDEDNDRYYNLTRLFSDATSVERLTYEELYSALLNVFAFADTFRFYEGGKTEMKRFFMATNEESKVKSMVKYLLFGDDEFTERVYNCLNRDDLKLEGYGESGLKELYGVVNQEDIPICNGRTLKSMEYLGFGKL